MSDRSCILKTMVMFKMILFCDRREYMNKHLELALEQFKLQTEGNLTLRIGTI